MSKIEYRVRPVTRFIVTRHESHDPEADDENCRKTGSSVRGEYDNTNIAYEVAYALCKAEHDRLGYPPGDERIVYPERLVVAPNGRPDSAGAPRELTPSI